MARRRNGVALTAIVGVFLLVYLVPIFYTGNYVAIPQNPVPSWSKVYGSLTCVIWLRLQNQASGSPFPFHVIGSNEPTGYPYPPQWNWLGVLYLDGNYYFRCNTFTLPPNAIS